MKESQSEQDGTRAHRPRAILARQHRDGWGAKVIYRVIVQQLAAQLPWFHDCMLREKLNGPEERLAYAAAAVDRHEEGWL